MISQSVDETSLRYPGWRVVAGCFVTAIFSWGLGFYGQGVFLAALQHQHHWDVSLVSGASTAYYLFSAILVIFVGDAITRFGPRRVMLFGIACLASSTLLIGQIDARWQFYVMELVMSFGWAALSVASISTIVGAWFHQRRGLALTLALMGASFGGMVTVPLLVLLIDRIGLPLAMFYAAVVTGAVLVPVTVWAQRPDSIPPAKRHAASTESSAHNWTRAAALRDFQFWTASAPTALVLFVQVGFLVQQIMFLESRIGRAEAGFAVAVTTGMSVVGRLSLGLFMDRINPRILSALSYLSQAAALLVMLWIPTPAMLMVACAVYGFSVGNVLVFPAIIIQREFAGAAFPMLISFATAIGQFIYSLGPGVMGLLRTLTGSYDVPLMLGAGLELVAVVIVLLGSWLGPATQADTALGSTEDQRREAPNAA